LLSITIAAHTTTYYTISGTVYDEQGNPLSGVVTRGLPNTPTTGEDGTYQDKVPAGWSGTVIPFKAGYSFDPPSRTYYPIAENQTGQIYNKPISVYTITVSASPAVGGTVDGGDTYTHGTEVTVTATPAEGYKFVNWTENGNVVSEAASYTFTAEGNRNLVANFTVITIIRYEITVTVSPEGGGTLTGGGTYEHGTEVTVTATPAEGYEFVKWTENETVVSGAASYTFTAESNRNLVANFQLSIPFTAWAKTYGGSASDSAYSIQQTSDGGYIVAGQTSSFGAGGYDPWVLKLRPGGSIDPSCPSGMVAESTAIPDSTSVTPSTSTATAKDSAGTITDTAVTPADTSAVVQTQCEGAYETYEITVTASPGEGGTVDGGGTYTHGTEVTVTAAPNKGYEFVNWTEGETVVSEEASYTFTAERNRNLVANFTVITPPDVTPPTVTSFNPADNATGIGATSSLGIIFSENVVKGETGDIVIRNASDASEFETIAVTSSKVTVSDNVVTIDPAGTFGSLTGYFVQIGSTCFKDAAGNYFAGISDATIWNFTSAEMIYTITASAGAGGSISPSGTVTVNHGSDQTFTITPNTGYHVSDVVVDDLSVGTVTSYTFTEVTSNHTINATFAINTYTISGTVTSGGSGLAGVVMSGLPGNPSTKSSGYYSATVNHGWSGTATPTKAGYTFNPTTRNYTGVSSNFSEQNYTALTVPTQLSPPDGSMFVHYPRTTTLQWSTVTGAASYKVEWQYQYNGTWSTGIFASGITTTSYTFDFVGDQPGRWRVWAVSTNGLEGPKSGWWGFSYITSPPTQISPPDGSVFDFYPRTTTLTWSAVPGAATYKLEIEWYDPGNGSWQPYPIVTGLTTTSYTFNFIGAQPGRWRVCAVSTNGLEGPKSSWWGFSYTQ